MVGGGISGLTTALTLYDEALRRGESLDCTVLEAQPYWGGKIRTSHQGGRIIEGGPDSFLTIKPGGVALCERLGLVEDLINTNEGNSQTFAYSRGRLREFPQGLVSMVPTQLGPLFKSGLVSWPGILRMAGDWWISPRAVDAPEETLAGFFTRRLGREAFDRLIEPLVAGIYAGNASELSVAATFPQFVDLERRHGGLIKGALAQQRARGALGKPTAPKRTLFNSLKGGMSDLVLTLVERLNQQGARLLLGVKALTLRAEKQPDRQTTYVLCLQDGEEMRAEAIVLATPAYVTGELLRELDSGLSSLLADIGYASTITLSLVFPRDQVQGALNGFGFVVPRVEDRKLIAATWSSMKWSGRVNPQESLVRCYLGGQGRGDVQGWDDEHLIRYSLETLAEMVGVSSQPTHAEVYRWVQGMPQYNLGHADRVRRIESQVESHPGLSLTGAAYHGIGIPDCIRDGQQKARSLASFLWKGQSEPGN